MKQATFALVTGLVLGIAVPTPHLFAQAPPAPESPSGTWWSVGVEAAGTRLTCDPCARSRDLGVALMGSMGAWASPQVRVGLEGSGWTRREGDLRTWVYGAGVVAEVHPRLGSGLHLLGGVGWLGYRAEDFTYDGARLRLGVGWDLPLTDGWRVGNRVVLDAAGFSPLDNEDEVVARSVGLSVLRVGVYLRRR